MDKILINKNGLKFDKNLIFKVFGLVCGLAVLFGYGLLSGIDLKIGLVVIGGAVVFFWTIFDIRIGWWLLLISLLIGQLVRIPVGGTQLLVSDGIMVILLVAWLINILVRRQKIAWGFEWYALVGFWLVSFLINLSKINQYSSETSIQMWMYWVRLVVYTLSLPITRSIAQWYGNTYSFFKWYIWTGFVFLLIGFVQLKVVPDISFLTDFGWDPHQGRLLSSFLDPNFAGAWLILLFGVSYGIFLSNKEWTDQKIIWSVVSALFFLGIVLTLSRSAYVGLGVVFVLLSWWKDKRMLLMGFFAGLLLVVSNPRIYERIQGIASIDETAQLRLVSWQQGYEVIEDNWWWGIGYNTLATEQLRRGFIDDPEVHSAGGFDSSYLTVWSTMGLIGLTIFVLFWVILMSLLMKKYFQYQEMLVGWSALGVFAGVLGVLIHAQFTNSLLYPHVLMPVLVLIAIVLQWKKEKNIQLN